MNENIKTTLDAASAVTAIGALIQYLPPVAAALTIIWTTIRIYEWARGKWKKDDLS